MSDNPSTHSLEDVKSLARMLGNESDSGTLARALAAQLANQKNWTVPSEIKLRGEILRKRLSSYNQTFDFKIGDIVRWKEGMRNRKRPTDGEPCIVAKLLAQPLLERDTDSGSTYFQEQLNIVLGVLDANGDFLFWHFDKNRFEPIPTT